MNKKRLCLIVLLIIGSFILSGYTIIDYDEYREPSWVWRDKDGYTITPQYIKPKIEVALKRINGSGLHLNDFTIYISPYTYTMVNGFANKFANAIVVSNNSYDTIYHEIGHIYAYQNKDIIKRYEKAMRHYYPNHIPKGTLWEQSISEDFAEEFKKIFTGIPKRTNYPDFPNFYDWLLNKTQYTVITRREVFDKLGGTEQLINDRIVIGNPQGDYMLDKSITRAELATVLVRLYNLNKPNKTPFKDIKKQWYAPYVERIYGRGLIKGYPDNTFGGYNNITRYELHTIINRL